MQQGVTTYLSEAQATAVKLAITSQLESMQPPQNCGSGSKVTTRLEKELIIRQAMLFQDEIIADLESDNAEVSVLKAGNAALQLRVSVLQEENTDLMKRSRDLAAHKHLQAAFDRFNTFIGEGRRENFGLRRWVKLLAIPGFGEVWLKRILSELGFLSRSYSPYWPSLQFVNCEAGHFLVTPRGFLETLPLIFREWYPGVDWTGTET
jgi:hypothetical protein